jgi:hypothetical protein
MQNREYIIDHLQFFQIIGYDIAQNTAIVLKIEKK